MHYYFQTHSSNCIQTCMLLNNIHQRASHLSVHGKECFLDLKCQLHFKSWSITHFFTPEGGVKLNRYMGINPLILRGYGFWIHYFPTHLFIDISMWNYYCSPCRFHLWLFCQCVIDWLTVAHLVQNRKKEIQYFNQLKIMAFWFKFYWIWFIMDQLTISQDWFR